MSEIPIQHVRLVHKPRERGHTLGFEEDLRDRAATERDVAADERDRVADVRDAVADQRDVDVAERDARVDGLVRSALMRDKQAEKRDRDAEVRDDLADQQTSPEAGQSILNRALSAADRLASGTDRDLSAGDRADLLEANQRLASRQEATRHPGMKLRRLIRTSPRGGVSAD